MSLGPFTIGTSTFVAAGNGRYINSSNVFGGPKDELKIAPGTFNKKANPPSTAMSVTRTKEFDVLDANGAPTRHRVTLVNSVTATQGITVEQIDVLEMEHSDLLTPALINQIMNGGS